MLYDNFKLLRASATLWDHRLNKILRVFLSSNYRKRIFWEPHKGTMKDPKDP